MILYFVPYYLNGLAENWEIIAFFIGASLLVIEIFIIPGFGIFGVFGLLFTVGSLTLMMVNNDWFDFTFVAEEEMFKAILVTITSMFGGILILFFGGVRIANSKIFQHIALVDVQDRKDGYTSKHIKEDMIGKLGTAYTILRPSGKIMIEGKTYDAFTRGEYLEKNEAIQVIDDEGTSLKVKAHIVEKKN